MKYPMLSLASALQIAQERKAARAASSEIRDAANIKDATLWWVDDLMSDVHAKVKWWGEGTEMDDTFLEDARVDIEQLVYSMSFRADAHSGGSGGYAKQYHLDSDQVEGKSALYLYQAIEHAGVTAVALDDPGFWRYVTLAYFWNFAIWREFRAFSASTASTDTDEDAAAGKGVGTDAGVAAGKNVTADTDASGEDSAHANLAELSNRFTPYIDGVRYGDCVLLRMYLRVKSLGGLEHGHLAWSVKGGTDFWRSHILRVQVGQYPQIVRAMVRRQADTKTRLNATPLRAFARELNRALVNLVPDMLDDSEADLLVGEMWERQRS